VTYPNLSIRIPSQQENIQFDIEEMDDEPQPRSKKGRPAKYMTEDEKYKAKLESNKQKRREKAAAKKEKKPEPLERPYNLVKQILTELDRKGGNYGDDRDPFGFIKDFIIIPERQGVSKADIINNAYKYFQRATNINYDITHSVLMKPLFLELKELIDKENLEERPVAVKIKATKKPEEQREKAIQEFNTMRDRVIDVIDHMFQKYKGKLGNKMTEMDWKTLQIYGEMYWLKKIRVKYNDHTILRQHGISLDHSDPYKSDNWDKRINDFVTYKKLTKEMLDYFISKTKVEFPPPDSDILPDYWINLHLSKK
jgi:hypothetical protein